MPRTPIWTLIVGFVTCLTVISKVTLASSRTEFSRGFGKCLKWTMLSATRLPGPKMSRRLLPGYECDSSTRNPFFRISRVSHRLKLSLGTFTKYEYHGFCGQGVDVYVIDTGININHTEFERRASWGRTVPADDTDEDNNGHGTHCAGTIALRKCGVAKSANVMRSKFWG